MPTRTFEPRWSNKTQKETTTWLEKIQKSKFGIYLAGSIIILGGAAALSHNVNDILLGLKIKTADALVVAADDAKSKFTQELIRAAWNRIYWLRRYLLVVSHQYPQAEQEDTWNSYISSTTKWNTDLMVNIMLLNTYYGEGRSVYFERKIQEDFRGIHYCLERLRHPTLKFNECQKDDILSIMNRIKLLNDDLYCFVTGLSDEGGACGFTSPKGLFARWSAAF
jgi:hypothetical protein